MRRNRDLEAFFNHEFMEKFGVELQLAGVRNFEILGSFLTPKLELQNHQFAARMNLQKLMALKLWLSFIFNLIQSFKT